MLYTRREIGKLVLAGVPAAQLLLTGDRVRAAAEKPHSVWGGVEIGMNAPYNFDKTNRMSAADVAARCLQLGVSVLELRSQPVESYLGAPPPAPAPARGQAASPDQENAQKAAAAALEKWRLAVPMSRVQAFRKMYEDQGLSIAIVKFDGIFAMSDDAVDYCFTLAKNLGARAISCEISVPDTKRLGQFADKHKMMVGYHGHQQTKPEDWEQAFSYAQYNGANVDLGHFVAGNNISPIPFITKYHDRVTHVHVKDMKMHNGPAVPFGTGDVPLKETLQLIRDRKWKIVGVIEYEYKAPDGSTDMAEMAKTVAYCKDALLS